MKKLLTVMALASVATLSYAQGSFNFANTSGTLISAGGTATTGAAGDYLYAVFFAPSTTVTSGGQSAGLFTNPAFQIVGGTNANVATVGRMSSRNGLAETTGTWAAGSTVDFLVRGWSKNAGATWAEALAFWNNGLPTQDMYLGQTVICNDLVLGGGPIPVNGLFGVNPFQSNTGFDMVLYPAPEPSSLALAGLGAALLLFSRRR